MMVTAGSWFTVCASCRTVRAQDGSWKEPGHPLSKHEEALVTHTVCPRCTLRLYPELYAKLVQRYPEIWQKDR